MPNWCVGELKVRGTKKNLREFLSKGLMIIDRRGNAVDMTVEASEDGIYIYSKSSEAECFYLKGSKRQFIKTNVLDFGWWNKSEDTEILFILPEFEGAYDIDVEILKSISTEFSVDFHIYGFEKGMEFNRDVMVVSGIVIRDDVIEFEDYKWECVSPSLGG